MSKHVTGEAESEILVCDEGGVRNGKNFNGFSFSPEWLRLAEGV